VLLGDLVNVSGLKEHCHSPLTPQKGPPVSSLRQVELLGDAPLSRDSWNNLLEAVAGGDQELVVHAPSGRRIVLVAESQLTRLRRASNSDHAKPQTSLTPRERQILLLLEEGRSGADVARDLGVAANTVAQHLAATRRKLGVRTSANAVRAARDHGLLD
jgi:DNA-binding NarL/FixJ family response regulator